MDFGVRVSVKVVSLGLESEQRLNDVPELQQLPWFVGTEVDEEPRGYCKPAWLCEPPLTHALIATSQSVH